jgi:hypothetical protein
MALDFATDRPQVVIAAVLKAMCEAERTGRVRKCA